MPAEGGDRPPLPNFDRELVDVSAKQLKYAHENGMTRWVGIRLVKVWDGHVWVSPEERFGEVRQRKRDKAAFENFDAEAPDAQVELARAMDTEKLRGRLGSVHCVGHGCGQQHGGDWRVLGIRGAPKRDADGRQGGSCGGRCAEDGNGRRRAGCGLEHAATNMRQLCRIRANRRFRPPTKVALLFREQLVPDITGRGRQSNAARLPPDSFVDLVLVANGQGTGCFSGDKDRVTHLFARATVL